MLAKYPDLQNSLKYIYLTRNNKAQYILMYGSFANANVAKKTIDTLPEEFKQAWPKRFNAIQQEINQAP